MAMGTVALAAAAAGRRLVGTGGSSGVGSMGQRIHVLRRGLASTGGAARVRQQAMGRV